MNPRSIYDDFSWAKEYDGQCVVYLLRWLGKCYVGGTSRFRGRLGDWRKFARKLEVPLTVRILVVCDKASLAFFEEANIRIYETFTKGHNKSPTGGLVGHKMHPNTAAVLHKPRPMHPNTRAALLRVNTGRVPTQRQREAVAEANRRRKR